MPRLVFAGSSDFAVPSLEALAGGSWEVSGVLTQPPRPTGRRRRLMPTPVGQRAAELGLETLTPVTLRDPASVAQLAALRPEVLVVVDYGLILPGLVLSLPAHGCVNGHASLLPRWRGAAPIQAAILAGDATTGISIMSMDKGLDTGPVYKMQDTNIGELETAGELRTRLAAMCAELLAATLPEIVAGRLRPRPQDETFASYAGKITPEDAEVHWQGAAIELARRIRAFAPRPGAWTTWRGQRLKLHRAGALAEAEGPPGRVWRAGPEGIDVATGLGSVRLLELQAPGGRVLVARDFLNGRALLGEQLGA
ncbi:methionyl-tRNA formyltransferase [Thioalkalivibrio sp. XN279]|uniref:methionyl-tRNA formyltransferase n=1 Tax=Thioalkalivibrio sp. XN279 TaxID=2714953 RepID=UPI00351B282D